jgi:hypothetical protein
LNAQGGKFVGALENGNYFIIFFFPIGD